MPQPAPELPPPVLRPRHTQTHYRCAACGYGVMRHEPPLHCPICGRHEWDVVDRHPAEPPATDEP